MEKTIKLNLQADGKLNVVGSEDTLGFQSESLATTLRITLPKGLSADFQHYVEFLAPSGDSKSSVQLEKHVDPSDSSDYIELALQTPLIQESGRYVIQYVGRILATGKVIKSSEITLDVADSINASNNMEETNPDWIAWAEGTINGLDDRVTALENGEAAEVHSDGVGIRDGEIVVKDATGEKKIKGSGKTLEEVHTQAVTAATAQASADATAKANAAKAEAISTASADATSKATTAKNEAIAAASADATSKANAAKSEAIAAANTNTAQAVEIERQRAIAAENAKQDTLNSASVIQVKRITAEKIDAGLEVTYTAPVAPNPNGLKFAILTEEPDTYYQGYFYIIQGE